MSDIRIQVRSPDTDTDYSTAADGDLLVFNKMDLTADTSLPDNVLTMSASTGKGFSVLENALSDRITKLAGRTTAPLITRRRHREALEAAMFHVTQARSGLELGMGAELVADDVRLASRALSSLIGEIGVEEVLGSVFSSFCIGK